ncbi:MAG: FHA domain-containing protein [Chromatiales bacterium]|nr:FHA domain-containing protein [Chromatiales bacterium]
MAKLTLFYKGRSVDSYPLTKKYTSIGRRKDCDIIIDSSALADKQAVITQLNDSFQIIGFNPTKPLIINHERKDNHTLTHGDVLQLGPYSLTYTESTPSLDFIDQPVDLPPPPPKSNDKLAELVGSLDVLPQSCLQIINGEHLGKTIPLQRSLLRLGLSGEQCAVIAHRSDGYYLTHLEGDGSPLVNGEEIADRSVMLSDGNIIQIGDIQMRFYEETKQTAAI